MLYQCWEGCACLLESPADSQNEPPVTAPGWGAPCHDVLPVGSGNGGGGEVSPVPGNCLQCSLMAGSFPAWVGTPRAHLPVDDMGMSTVPVWQVPVWQVPRP